jgi:ABC-type transport system involved in multi-copper enzyme maturation permease subunit
VANPLIHRELITVLRQRRMVLLQCGVAIALALLIVVRWPTEPRMGLSGSRAQEVFRLFSFGLLSALLLFLPVFPATNIVREKKSGTLALLLNSPLGPRRIFGGKFLGVLGLAGLILSLSLPAAGACYALGGISLTRDLLAVYAILALTSLQYAALGLLVSTYCTTMDAAVRWTYGLVVFFSVLLLGPHQFFQGTESSLADVGNWLRCVSPFAALMSVVGTADLGGAGLVSSSEVPMRFAVISLLLTAVYSVWTMSRLNYTIFDVSRDAGRMSDDRNAGMRLLRRLVFVVDPQKRSRAIGPFVNPVMVKEFRCRRFGRLHWLLRLVALCAVLSLTLTYATVTGTLDWGVDTIGGIMVLMQVALLVLITPSLAAGLISTERETGGWVMLQMTPMSVFRIVRGKLLSVVLTLMLILCATLPGYVVMVYIEPGLRLQVERVVICMIATAAFAMFLSAAVGSLFQKTAAATAAAYAALLAVCGAPLLIWLGRDAPFGHETVERALLINPIAAAMSVIRLPGFRDYRLLPANWWFLGIASVACLVILVAQTHRISRPR